MSEPRVFRSMAEVERAYFPKLHASKYCPDCGSPKPSIRLPWPLPLDGTPPCANHFHFGAISSPSEHSGGKR